MIKNLAKKLAAFEEFSADVIAEVKFFRGSFAEGAEILKFARGLKIIEVAGEGKILVKLMTPRGKISAVEKVSAEKNCWLTFTAEEVKNFVEEVDDKNKIHQTKNPVVPGLLILEKILEVEPFSEEKFLRLRFKNFVVAGEKLNLRRADEKVFEILSGDEVKIFVCTA